MANLIPFHIFPHTHTHTSGATLSFFTSFFAADVAHTPCGWKVNRNAARHFNLVVRVTKQVWVRMCMSVCMCDHIMLRTNEGANWLHCVCTLKGLKGHLHVRRLRHATRSAKHMRPQRTWAWAIRKCEIMMQYLYLLVENHKKTNGKSTKTISFLNKLNFSITSLFYSTFSYIIKIPTVFHVTPP